MKTEQNSSVRALSASLKRRRAHLWPWLQKHGISCYRIYNRDSGEAPIAADIYDGYLHVLFYSQKRGVTPGLISAATSDVENEEAAKQEDKSRQTASPRNHARSSQPEVRAKARRLADTVARFMGVPAERLFVKVASSRHTGLIRTPVSTTGHTVEAHEAGLSFVVNLTDYLHPGLPLHHRLTRGMIGEISYGRRVLNLFCGPGENSVYAAAGGADRIVNVDSVPAFRDWAHTNLKRNGFGPGLVEHHVVDMETYLRSSHQRKERFDLVIAAPPATWSREENGARVKLRSHHRDILRRIADVLHPQGEIVFLSDDTGLYLNSALKREFRVETLTNETTSEDFANRREHQAWLLQPK